MKKVKKEEKKDKKDDTKKVDCSSAKKGVWLVKVPRYLSEVWQKQPPGAEVGKVRAATTGVFFHSNESILAQSSQASTSKSINKGGVELQKLGAKASNDKVLPPKHEFVMNPVGGQTLAVLTEDKSRIDESTGQKSGRLCVEGRIVRRAEFRPPTTTAYMKMKINHIEKACRPTSQVQQLDKAAVKYKPVAIHSEDIRREKLKKSGMKAVRADKDIVRNLMFEAFEKHQYYRLVDMANLTRQPPGYVKEILNEIAVYNTAPPHKSMWELKPEYRAYQVNKDEEMDDA